MEDTVLYQGFLQRWQTRWFGERPADRRISYALYETAWADAWPHLDDWFKAGMILREFTGNRHF